MEQKITIEQVKRVANLCNLILTSDQEVKLAEMLTDTLDAINVLDELDTSEVSETFQVTGLRNVYMNGHDNEATFEVDDALANAAEKIKNHFVTKAVFDR